MRLLRTGIRFVSISALSLVALAAAGCQPAADTNTNANVANANANVTAANANTMTTVSTVEGLREPDRYSATMSISAATSGQQQQQAQTEIKVARNGPDRRYAIDTRVPGVGEIVFLDKADKRYIILPARRQYTELSADAAGFGNLRSMTPGQMVEYIERQQGLTRVGEETINGRRAIKYRYAGQTNTNTQAGQVAGESFIWVDTETGLPLRIEGFSQSTGNVQGVSGGRAVIEMRNLSPDVDPSLFEVPTDYSKITEEQLRQGANAVMGFLQALMGSANAQGGTGTTATPAASPAPAR